jgi:hypothetical protein
MRKLSDFLVQEHRFEKKVADAVIASIGYRLRAADKLRVDVWEKGNTKSVAPDDYFGGKKYEAFAT